MWEETTSLVAAAAPAVQPREGEDRRRYNRLRWSVFVSATLGYGVFYVCRLSFNVIKTSLAAKGIFTESQLGIIGSCLFFSYAAGKLANGFLADRVNIRRFMSVGLLGSALLNLALGSTTSFYFFAVLWGLNGWLQSMGAPSCVVALSRWYTHRERGSYYGFWSASHNIGEALTFLLIAFLVSAGGWQWGFRGAGLLGLAGAALVWFGLHDRPETKGLRALGVQRADSGAAQSVGRHQAEVLRNPYIWVLALASSFMYISRYAINSWGIFFLQSHKGYTTVEASSVVSVSAVCGVAGTVLSGVVSDRLFRGSRNVPALLFGILNAASIGVFLFVPGHHAWVDIGAMVVFGLSIGALICFLGGLMAVDIASKKASGAALGVVGIASYIGAGIQDIVSGRLIEGGKTLAAGGTAVYDFSTVSLFWFASAVLSFILALFVWKAKVQD